MDTMLGHRVLLHGLATPGWSEQSGRVVGKREKDGRILVLLDDGREVIHVHRPSVLVQQERVKERAVERREREQLSERERASTREREGERARGRHTASEALHQESDILRARPDTQRKSPPHAPTTGVCQAQQHLPRPTVWRWTSAARFSASRIRGRQRRRWPSYKAWHKEDIGDQQSLADGRRGNSVASERPWSWATAL